MVQGASKVVRLDALLSPLLGSLPPPHTAARTRAPPPPLPCAVHRPWRWPCLPPVWWRSKALLLLLPRLCRSRHCLPLQVRSSDGGMCQRVPARHSAHSLLWCAARAAEQVAW